MAGLGGLLYGVDFGVIAAAEPYLMALGFYSGTKVSLIVGAVLSFLIPMSVLKGQLKSVRMQAAASSYVRPGSRELRQQRDIFLFRNVTRTARPKNNSSSGGGGGGGSSRSTGGRSGSV